MDNKNNGPKRQHIEPKRHLKYFADTDEKTYAMHKKSNMSSLDILSKKTSIEKICVEKYFYTLSPAGNIEDAFLVEKQLAKAEDRFFQTVESILEKKCQFCSRSPGQALFDYEIKEEIANFVYLQMLRGKTTRMFASKEARRIYDRQTEELAKEIRSQFKLSLCEIRRGLDRHKDELIKNSLPIILIEERENSVIFRLLMCGRCSLLINATKIPFVTSDEPVVVTDYNLSKYGLYHKALFDSDACVIYPLCPELLIVFHSFWEPLARYGGVFLGQQIYEPSVVEQLNYLQLLNCQSFIVSDSRDTLEHLKNQLASRAACTNS